MRVDINCDMGESFGAYTIGADQAVFPYITSANIACGFHGGDPSVMRKTVGEAKARGVGIGAHPGFDDLAGFGRRNIDIAPDDAYALIVYQVGALAAFAAAAGTGLQHVKAHGAIYNMAVTRRELADAIAHAVRDVDPSLIFFALPNSELSRAGEAAGLRVACEVFADRNYMPDGSLVSRKRPDAHVSDVKEATDRSLRMVREGRVRAVDGEDIEIRADTICIHGDGPHAADFARALRDAFVAEGIEVRAIGA